MAEQHKITLHVAGKPYTLVSKDEQYESDLRFAAEDVNKLLERYNSGAYGASELEDKLVFVALNQAVMKVKYRRMLEEVKAESDRIALGLADYLKKE